MMNFSLGLKMTVSSPYVHHRAEPLRFRFETTQKNKKPPCGGFEIGWGGGPPSEAAHPHDIIEFLKT